MQTIHISTARTALMALLLAVAGAAYSTTPPAGFSQQIDEFTKQIAQRHHLDLDGLTKLFRGIEYQGRIIKLMNRPAEAKPWRDYRPIFVTRQRAKEGVKFWQQHQNILARAEEVYGIPAEIIVAIIGVETRYGRHTGGFKVLDALSTLAFGYPKRADFFRKQLEEFLLLVREEQLPAEKLIGSYAGAMGLPQFIPSSYRAYAVDFDGDKTRNLIDDPADAIGSVAAYFNRHGWKRGEPVTMQVRSTGHPETLIEKGMKPSIPLSELSTAGITWEGDKLSPQLVSLVALEGEKGMEYWLGLNNFYVITRYNHSNLYAMAVYQLSQKILQIWQKERT